MILSVVIGIVRNEDGEFFITRRHNTLHLGGLWEFAGGKVERGEMLNTALSRELREEIGIEVISVMPLITFHHDYFDRKVRLHVFEITEFSGTAENKLGQGWIWVKPCDLKNYVFPAANRAILTALRLPPYYAILNDDVDDLLAELHQLLAQDIKLIQARLKNLTAQAARDFLTIAYPLCQEHGTILLVNSGMEQGLEMQTLSDGVHLTSLDLLSLTHRPKDMNWVGASCHNLEELKHAEKIGADFAVLSPVQTSQTHPEIEPLSWSIFLEWVAECDIPVYALGGLEKTDLQTARFAGGQGIAGIRAFK
jgi:8-oxo-dGTP diphosphatase